jgi:hypothetical protein
MRVVVNPPFALMQKVEPKMEANPNDSACFAGQRTATVITILTLFLQVAYVAFVNTTFSNAHASILTNRIFLQVFTLFFSVFFAAFTIFLQAL